jgi:hypothetical protein
MVTSQSGANPAYSSGGYPQHFASQPGMASMSSMSSYPVMPSDVPPAVITQRSLATQRTTTRGTSSRGGGTMWWALALMVTALFAGVGGALVIGSHSSKGAATASFVDPTKAPQATDGTPAATVAALPPSPADPAAVVAPTSPAATTLPAATTIPAVNTGVAPAPTTANNSAAVTAPTPAADAQTATPIAQRGAKPGPAVRPAPQPRNTVAASNPQPKPEQPKPEPKAEKPKPAPAPGGRTDELAQARAAKDLADRQLADTLGGSN